MNGVNLHVVLQFDSDRVGEDLFQKVFPYISSSFLDFFHTKISKTLLCKSNVEQQIILLRIGPSNNLRADFILVEAAEAFRA
jgi:hypothetical protein